MSREAIIRFTPTMTRRAGSVSDRRCARGNHLRSLTLPARPVLASRERQRPEQGASAVSKTPVADAPGSPGSPARPVRLHDTAGLRRPDHQRPGLLVEDIMDRRGEGGVVLQLALRAVGRPPRL